MTTYIYDGSFEGLLSCVFAIYQTKTPPTTIVPQQQFQAALLGDMQEIITDEDLAGRVLRGVATRAGEEAAELVYQLFLSEQQQIELLIYRLIRKLMQQQDAAILSNFADETILHSAQIAKMIGREVHRMHAFVRFQKNRNGCFYAAIDPDFNVLPLLGDHFERRYADQPWIIFDTRRHYGLHYNLHTTEFISDEHPQLINHTGQLPADLMDEQEKIYQALWERYFQAVNIQTRKNTKLHLRHMPKRYWKYLIEKRQR